MTVVLSASSLTGAKIENSEGEELGKVEDLVVDLESGRVAYAVVAFGKGFRQSGKLFAVPWASLAVVHGTETLFLNAPREKLESAEGFDKDHWPDLADPAFRIRTDGHFGIEPW